MNIQDRKKTLTIEELRRRYNLDSLVNDRKAIRLQKEQLNKVNNELHNFVEVTIENLKEIQDQVDGNITTWFFNGEPTLENEPTSNWITIEEKNNHLGDLYYDKETGYAYRFTNDNNSFSWIKLTDSDVTQALALANSAQDTADSKRRIFVLTPVPPYDIGDIWLKEDKDLYRCRCSRVKEDKFNDTDWIIATKYTDDTVALQTKGELDQFKTEVTENYTTNATLETTVNSINAQVTEAYNYTTTVKNEVNGLSTSVNNTIENINKLTVDVNGINAEVSKKVNNSDYTAANIFAKINGDTSSAGINADKILLTANDILNLIAGNEINLGTKKISISSDNFSVDESGMQCKNALLNNITIDGGSITLYDDSRSSLKVVNQNNPDIFTLYNSEGIVLKKNGMQTVLISNNPWEDGGYISVGTNDSSKTTTIENGHIGATTLHTRSDIECDGSIKAKNIDSGRCVLTASGERTINFNKTFTSEPNIVLTPITVTNGVIAAKITGISTTYFKATIGGTSFGDTEFAWIAMTN